MTLDQTALVVTADAALGRQAGALFGPGGWKVVGEVGGPRAAAVVRDAGARLLVLDLELPGLDRGRLREALAGDGQPPEPLEAMERRQIALALAFTGGNRRRAAQLLGLARSTLLAKLRRYGLDTRQPQPTAV